jgi:T4 superinfection immunity protein
MNANETGGLILILIGLACCFLPTLVALMRGKANGTGGVFFVNLLLGWTVVGWFVSFIWACSGTTNADKRREERQHAELLAAVRK